MNELFRTRIEEAKRKQQARLTEPCTYAVEVRKIACCRYIRCDHPEFAGSIVKDSHCKVCTLFQGVNTEGVKNESKSAT